MLTASQWIAVGLATLICCPAAAQVSSATGSQGTYQQQGQDTGYDDMKANMEHRETPDELATGAALVKQAKYSDAIPHLEAAEKKKPHDVTVLIYLGFSHRMIGGTMSGDPQAAEFKKALDCYRQALAIDPNNKIAHEFLGKLDLLMREYAQASDELKALESLCDSSCPERTALAQAITANPPPPTAQGPVSKP